jgi:predicted Zn-dependent protease with MMP-like domain
MDLGTFESAVRATLDALPRWVAAEMENVAVIVERRATKDQDPQDAGLLGIYEGVPLPERGIDYFGVTPDRITIFYDPHATLDLPDDELASEIRVTLLHEIGHHLGLDDARLHELGWS